MYQTREDLLDGFSWNDEIDRFESFPAEGIPNPFAWHIAFFRHPVSMLR